MKKFDEHKKLHKRVNFHHHSQCHSESVDAFVRNLCQSAEHWDFGAKKDEQIQGCTFIGIADNEVPQRL